MADGRTATTRREEIEAAADTLATAIHELAVAISELRRCHACNRFTSGATCRHCGAEAQSGH